MVIGGSFLVAGSDAPALFEPVDQPFHPVALPVRCPVEARGGSLVLLGRNHHPDAASTERLADGLTAVALVGDQTTWPEAGATTTATLDSAPRGQGRQGYLVIAFPAGQDEDDRLALPLGPYVDFGAEPTPTPAQRFGRWVPFFAPAAC